MRFDMRAVEGHSFRRLSRFGHRLEDALPNSLRTPAVEAIVDRFGRPIFRRTIDPSTSALEHMHDPAQNAPIVKRFHGTTCQACDMKFADRYGPIGEGFIEAHHLNPIGTLEDGKPVEYDLATDFPVLCSNCHRLIHK